MGSKVIFIIQKIHGKDFVESYINPVLEAIDYMKWLAEIDDEIRVPSYYIQDKVGIERFINYEPENIIPVGSLEFVNRYLQDFYGGNTKKTGVAAMNIPRALNTLEFVKREIEPRIEVKGLTEFMERAGADEIFIKPCNMAKEFEAMVTSEKDLRKPRIELSNPEAEVFASRLIDIEDEYRIFVFNGRIVGCKPVTSKMPLYVPDEKLVNKMIRTWKDSPRAYTLDVGVNESGTFLVEAHPFISVGLYGFGVECSYLLEMYKAGWRYVIAEENRYVERG